MIAVVVCVDLRERLFITISRVLTIRSRTEPPEPDRAHKSRNILLPQERDTFRHPCRSSLGLCREMRVTVNCQVGRIGSTCDKLLSPRINE